MDWYLPHYVYCFGPYMQAIESVGVINTVTSILTGNMTHTMVRSEIRNIEDTSFYNAYPHTATQSTYTPYPLR